jgi:hypothetical protein
MIIRFSSDAGPIKTDTKQVSEMINQFDQYFSFDQFKVAVFSKGGCCLSHTLEDGRTISLQTHLGILFGEVYASKVRPIVCKSFAIFINQKMVHVVAKIQMDKGILSFHCADMAFNMDLNRLYFNHTTFHHAISVEATAARKIG